jgi:heme exporter protein D
MTPHQSVALALRLFAIWVALQTLRTLPAFFTMGGFDSRSYVWMAVTFALNAVVILAFWVFPRTIAGKLVPPPDPEPQPSSSPDQWLAVGCTLLGLWTLTATIPRIAYEAFVLGAMSSSDDHSQLQHLVVYNLVELAIAVWLILGAKGVRNLFWWAQNAGIRKDL